MSRELEDVKVGQQVFLTEYKGHSGRIHSLETVATVTPNYIRLVGHGNATWHKSNGWPRGKAEYWIVAPTPEVLAKYEAEQAKQKADAEAAEAERQRAEQEKRMRLAGIGNYLGGVFGNVESKGDVITFEHGHYRYEIREID